jgi:AcrR family transcriptional regulator
MVESSGKRDAILEAMLDLIVERGFHNAPMSLVSKRARASAGVIYNYFPSKEDIIHALYLRVRAQKRDLLLEGYAPDAPRRDAFKKAFLNAYYFYRKQRREARFLALYENSPYFRDAAPDASATVSPEVAHFMKSFRSHKAGSVLKDLPAEAIDELTFGLASRLAQRQAELKPAALKKIADAVWLAIAEHPQ